MSPNAALQAVIFANGNILQPDPTTKVRLSQVRVTEPLHSQINALAVPLLHITKAV
jgi:hypothetical protein